MNNSVIPRLGPAYTGTLVTSCGQDTVTSYTQYLEQQVLHHDKLDNELAALWGTPAMQGAHYWIIGNQLGKPWLRIIEDTYSESITALRHTGWLSLEVCVDNVDALNKQLLDSPFEVIGPAANLDVSDKIRAMQVIGLAKEVLYLTEIKGEVPPFELPTADCAIDSLFIPVLCCHNRDESLKLYESIAGNTGLSFDTKITVINRAYGYPLQDRHPVATLQLADNTLIEIDQVAEATQRPQRCDHLPAGIAIISFMIDNLDTLPIATDKVLRTELPYNGRRVASLIGSAGEIIELIEKKTR